MHVITVNSVNSLLNYLTDKLKRTPSADIIQKWITEEKPEVTDKKVHPDKINWSAFTACLLRTLAYVILLWTRKTGEMPRGFHSIIRAYCTHTKWQNENQHVSKYLLESIHCAKCRWPIRIC